MQSPLNITTESIHWTVWWFDTHVAQWGKLHLPRVIMRRVNLDLPPESLLKKELEGFFAATPAMCPLPSSNFWLLLPGCFPPSASPVTTSATQDHPLLSHVRMQCNDCWMCRSRYCTVLLQLYNKLTYMQLDHNVFSIVFKGVSSDNNVFPNCKLLSLDKLNCCFSGWTKNSSQL